MFTYSTFHRHKTFMNGENKNGKTSIFIFMREKGHIVKDVYSVTIFAVLCLYT